MDENFLKSLESITQVKRFDLANGEPFAIVFKGDYLDQYFLEIIVKDLRSIYSKKNHKIAVFCVGKDEDVDYITLKELIEKADKQNE